MTLSEFRDLAKQMNIFLKGKSLAEGDAKELEGYWVIATFFRYPR